MPGRQSAIEQTAEMRAAFRAAQECRAEELVAQGAPLGVHDILDRGLDAVFEIVERDYELRRCDEPSWAGHRCTKPRGHDGGHENRFSGVVWP